MAPIYTCQFYLSINQHITSSVQVYLQCTYLFSHHSFLLDVLHPSTSSTNSTPSNNSSHPTKGRSQPFVYLLCAIQGALSLFFSLDVPSSQHIKCQFKPPNTRTIPYTPLSSISFRVLHQAEALHSRTPPQRLEVILFIESPNSCDSPLLCAE